jgi:RNA polymerase sigma-B factor
LTAPTTSPQAHEAVRQLHREYHDTPDPELCQRIVQAHTGLAYRLAQRFANRGEPLDDLMQVAMLGLIKAVQGFDPDRGLRFSTYATPTILGELKRYFRDRGWAVRLPRRVHDLYLDVQHAVDELAQEMGRSPTIPEVAERVGATEEQVLQAMEAGGLRRSTSLEAQLSPEDPRALANVVGDEDRRFEDVDRGLTLAVVVRRLPEIEQEIVRLRFAEGLTQQEIARRVGRSQMQVSRLLARSLQRLRAWISEGPLPPT